MKSNVIIIAEAGVNHNGDLGLAKKLIDVAAEAGVDYVKFQTFKTDKLVSKSAVKANYQLANTSAETNFQFDMLKRLEMPEEWFPILKEYAEQKKISFLSTGFDEGSIDFLMTLGLPFIKIPSGEITNKPFLQHVARKKKPIILSTGMATLSEIFDAVTILKTGGVLKEDITVLHCNTEYPTPMVDVNLLAMRTIGETLNVPIGYSDHTLGIEVPIAAVALGARVIEKHFTLDKNMEGPDHKASINPKELSEMVMAIRNIEAAISGNGIKEPSSSEQKNRTVARKSIFTKHPLKSGHVITSNDLEMKRPGDGISPMYIEEVIGRKTKRDLPEEYKLSLNDFI
jgi:N-acetylneuraminate synthase/N,N'-diacetyllegionaminate synthase